MAGIPAYARLAESLIRDVAAGRFPVGERLPTEAVLCAETGLSRGTVRQALQQLERLGMISRRTSDGSRVVSTAPVEDYHPVVTSSDEILELVRRTKIIRPEISEITIDGALARRLGARPGTDWQLVAGVRVPRDKPEVPLCWSEHYVRADGPFRDAVLRGDFSGSDPSGTQTEQIVSAELLSRELAERLSSTSETALVVTRRMRDRSGVLTSVGFHTHPSDRFSIRTVFRD